MEEDIRRRSATPETMGAKTLCHPCTTARLPLDSLDLPAGTKCFASGKPALKYVLLGRSY